ncbi:MAG: DUF368 domain-containing protein [Oscillospiraceae bacterium]|nr:DUF368 domain-containing protein [Oscillospiraceae bacterium]
MLFLKNIIYGIILGVSNIIPGVSGGTIAVVLNIYDKIISSIASFSSIKKNFCFLISLGIGCITGVFLFSSIINYFLNNNLLSTSMLFIGIIVGSIPMIYIKCKSKFFNIKNIFIFSFFLLLMIIMSIFSMSNIKEEVIQNINLQISLKILLVSIISSICMIIPGISGSFIILLFGLYSTIIMAINQMNILILSLVVVGVLIGIIFGAKLIGYLLKRFMESTYSAILGLVIGSIFSMILEILTSSSIDIKMNLEFLIGIFLLIIGVFLSYFFSNYKVEK